MYSIIFKSIMTCVFVSLLTACAIKPSSLDEAKVMVQMKTEKALLLNSEVLDIVNILSKDALKYGPDSKEFIYVSTINNNLINALTALHEYTLAIKEWENTDKQPIGLSDKEAKATFGLLLTELQLKGVKKNDNSIEYHNNIGDYKFITAAE